MKAVVFLGINDLRILDVPKPQIESPTDAVIEVTTCEICSSDIHMKDEGMQEEGKIAGHVYCGIIEAVGRSVRKFKKGDRVVGKSGFYCGDCFYCRREQYMLCEKMGVFGFHGHQGVHAEYARIPFADNSIEKIPDNLTDEQVIFAADILITGLTGVTRAQVGLGDTVAVFGTGRIGMGAVTTAQLFGPSLVIAVDILDYRLQHAQQFGAFTINALKEDPIAKIKELTDGRGVDASIEAVGYEDTFRSCIKSARIGGRVSVLGMFSQPVLWDITERGIEDMLTLSIGIFNTDHMDEILRLIESGQLDLRKLITHTFPLSEALRAYEVFENKIDNSMVVLIKP